MSDHAELISPDEARAAIVAELRTTVVERVALVNAHGRHLAETIVAPVDAPAFDNSAMDGFAFAFGGGEGTLRVVGVSAAGVPYAGRIASGCAVRIMTGAAVPDGCDTVAMREVCEVEGDVLTVDWAQVRRGDHIRRRGDFVRAGDAVFDAGTPLGASDIGLLASFGHTSVLVHSAPRVAIVTSGSELVEPGRALQDGEIYNSNAHMLAALLTQAGATATVLPVVRDELEEVRQTLRAAARAADLVITVGGVSVGDYDFVRDALLADASPMRFWRVRVKPGKPLAFGVLDQTPVIGLPGNPVSAFVGFHLFVRPALTALGGGRFVDRIVDATTAASLPSTPARREYVPGRLTGGTFVTEGDRSSGNPLLLRGCDALAVIDEGVAVVDAGAPVKVWLL